VIEAVARALGEDAVALRIDVGAKMKEHVAGVVHVHPSSTTTMILVNIICPMPQSPCMIL